MKRRDGAPAGPAGRRQFVTSQAFLTLLDPVDEPARPEEGRGPSWRGQQQQQKKKINLIARVTEPVATQEPDRRQSD